MFEKLVESTTQKKNGRTGRLFLVTGIAYAAVLTAVGVITVFWFNPALAESNSLTAFLMPPPPPGTPVPPKMVAAPKPQAASNIFAVPKQIIELKAIPKEMPRLSDAAYRGRIVPGSTNFGPINGQSIGVPGGNEKENDNIPPPPVKKAPPKVEEEVKTPAPPKIVPRSGGVWQGSAIRRVSPTYPAIARAARAFGVVQIQVEISEEGQVTSATALNGHPLLREAALQAARQWVWRPTTLSNVPVRVQGVLSFNFKLD